MKVPTESREIAELRIFLYSPWPQGKPLQKEGKYRRRALLLRSGGTSMKALPTRRGNLDLRDVKNRDLAEASMKAPPTRKGN